MAQHITHKFLYKVCQARHVDQACQVRVADVIASMYATANQVYLWRGKHGSLEVVQVHHST